MNIYYTKTSMCEFDFFKNDIFKKDFYNVKVNFILYDNNSKISNNQKNINIIVFNNGINLNFLENMIIKLHPLVIFNLSDEFGLDSEYYKLLITPNIKLFFHQYNKLKKIINYYIGINFHIWLNTILPSWLSTMFPDWVTTKLPAWLPTRLLAWSRIKLPDCLSTRNFQIPLGYMSGFLLNKPFVYKEQTIEDINNKKYDFSFIGEEKNDRITMLDIFSKNFKKSFIHVGKTNWSEIENQNIKPSEIFNIYKNSLFVPIGRGNQNLDCFRLYETIISGAIPVVCGSKHEINITFEYNLTQPYLITANTWEKAVLLCKELYYDKDKICNIINSNSRWFEEQIINISKNINQIIQN